jgi:hypothetical protein
LTSSIEWNWWYTSSSLPSSCSDEKIDHLQGEKLTVCDQRRQKNEAIFQRRHRWIALTESMNMTINNFHNFGDDSLGKPRLYCDDDDKDLLLTASLRWRFIRR